MTTAPPRSSAPLRVVPSLPPPGRGTPDPRDEGARTGVGRMVLAQLVGAAAVLLGATGIGNLLLGSAWWSPLVVRVVVVCGVGLLGTLTRLPWWSVTIGQVLAVAIAAGQLAGTGMSDLRLLVLEGLSIVANNSPPVELTGPLMLLLVVSFGLVAVLVDTCVRTVPTLAGLGVLAVAVTTMTISEFAIPSVAVLGPAAAYLLILSLSAAPAATGSAQARVRAGVATLGAGAVLGAAALGLGWFAPRIAPDLSTAGLLVRTDLADGRIGASPMTALTGDLLRGEPAPILELRSAGGTQEWQPNYLRAAVLTRYVAGSGWEAGRLTLGDVPEREYPEMVEVVSTGYAGWFLPVPDGTTTVIEPPDVWTFYPELDVWHVDRAQDPGRYLVGVETRRPLVDDLLVDTVNPAEGELDLDGVSQEVVELTAEITAGLETPFEKAQAIEQWFRGSGSGFTYSLTVPRGSTGDPLLDFLEMRQGYCEQYASTMAVLARVAGLPARVVVGYGPGSTQDGVTTITTHDAHAWVEVRFENAGWVRFEPTPPDGSAARLAGYAEPDVTPESTAGPQAEEVPTTTVSAPATDPEPSGAPTTGSEDSAGPAARQQGGGVGVWWLVALVAVAVVVLVGPNAERARRRRARLAHPGARRSATGGAAGSADGPASDGPPSEGAWAEVEALAVDHGVELPADTSVRESVELLLAQVEDTDRVRTAFDILVRGAEQSWYAAPDTAQRSGSDPALAARRTALAVGVVRVALVRARPRRGLARWFPRSLLPSRWRWRGRGGAVRRREPTSAVPD